MTDSPVRVSAIVVSYNVADLLVDCLKSLEAARMSGDLDEIIVIDCSSSDRSVEAVQRNFPNVTLDIVPNRGFGAGVNAGFERVSGDAVLILNPDTVVCPTTIPKLSNALFANEGTGVVGPRLIYPDGTLQSSRRRFPRTWTPVFESTIFEEWFPANPWVRHYRMLDPESSGQPTGQPVDWLVGAALMVKREMLSQVGGFDESFFLYGEELEWCYRIRRHGWTIRFVPDATIVHHEAASTSQDRLASRLEFDRGRVRAQRIIHGSRVSRRTARLLRLNFAIQLAREGLKWIVGHRRELRRRRITQYWELLRSRLDD